MRTTSFGSSWRWPGVSTSNTSATCSKRNGRSAWSARWRRPSRAWRARLDGEYQDALEARLLEAAQSGKTARRDLIQKLNQTARRLRHFENEGQWSHTLVDATRGFCGRAALFLIHDRKLHFEAAQKYRRPGPVAGDVVLDAAPAFAHRR